MPQNAKTPEFNLSPGVSYDNKTVFFGLTTTSLGSTIQAFVAGTTSNGDMAAGWASRAITHALIHFTHLIKRCCLRNGCHGLYFHFHFGFYLRAMKTNRRYV